AHDLVVVGGDDHDVVLAQLDGFLRVGDERRDVGAEEHAGLADAHDQRGGAARGDDGVRVVGVGEQEGERALEAVQHRQGGGLEVAGGAGGVVAVVGAGQQVAGDLGVGFGG